MLLETEYQECWEDDDILVFRWLKKTADMSDEEYIEEIKKSVKIIREQKKSKVLLLAKDMLYVISISLQKEANDILLPAYNESGVKRLAVVVPKHIIATLAVEQTIEERRVFHNFQTRYFATEEEAKEWLAQEV